MSVAWKRPSTTVNRAGVLGLLAWLISAALAVAVITALLWMLVPPTSGHQLRPIRTPCASEDSTGCVWDARHRGNGLGRSFYIKPNGTMYPLPHSIAHYLTH